MTGYTPEKKDMTVYNI